MPAMRSLSLLLSPLLPSVVMCHRMHEEPQTEMQQDQTAMNRFLAGIERRAFRMAEIATGDEDVALDVVQDSMLQLVRRYADRPEEELGALFHTILHNRLRDWHRRGYVTRRLFGWLKSVDEESDPVQTFPDQHRPGPEQHNSHDESLGSIMDCIRQLPMRQQQCFLLRAWEEYDVKETASIMGCSEGSVKTHYSRATIKLREMLQAEQGE